MTGGTKKERDSSQCDPVTVYREQSGRGQRRNFTGCCSCRVSPKVMTAKVKLTATERKNEEQEDRGKHMERHTKTGTHIDRDRQTQDKRKRKREGEKEGGLVETGKETSI